MVEHPRVIPAVPATAPLEVTLEMPGRHNDPAQKLRFAIDCGASDVLMQPCIATQHPFASAAEAAEGYPSGACAMEIRGTISQPSALQTRAAVSLRGINVSSSLQLQAPHISVDGEVAGGTEVLLHAHESLSCGALCHIHLRPRDEGWQGQVRLQAKRLRMDGVIVVPATPHSQQQSSHEGPASPAHCPRTAVQMLGDIMRLGSTARVVASGSTVQVGGSFGGDNTTHRANVTVVEREAHLTVDGEAGANAGCVAVWGDKGVVFRGSISARGGPDGGNGGFVEVRGSTYVRSLSSTAYPHIACRYSV